MSAGWIDQSPRPSLDLCERAATAALDCAVQQGIAIAIAIVDSAGRLICLKRMDAARPIASELAVAKARAAAAFERATDELQSLTAPGAAAFGAQFGAGTGILPGGLPILTARGLLAAVGASGADRDQDIACARAACISLAQKLQE